MIIVKPLEGLGNRMRVLNSCFELRKRNKLCNPIRMIWDKNELLNCDFSDLFCPIHSLEILKASSNLNYYINSNIYNPVRKRGKLKKMFYSLYYNKFNYYDNGSIIDWQFNDAYWASIKKYPIIVTSIEFYNPRKFNNYHLFKPLPHLQEKIDELSSSFKRPTIGLHVRRTDNLKSSQKSTDKAFEKQIIEYLKRDNNLIFYLATDDPQFEAMLKRKFPEHIMSNYNKTLNRNSKLGMQDAIVDLYVLSKSTRIIGSYWSSFSETASFIGGIPFKFATEI